MKKINFIVLLLLAITFSINCKQNDGSKFNENSNSEKEVANKKDIPVSKENPVASSSVYKSQNVNYSPENILDFSEMTAWVSGSENGGIGEWIALYLGEDGNIKNLSEVEVNILTYYRLYSNDDKANESSYDYLNPVEFNVELYVDEKLITTSNKKSERNYENISFVGIPFLLKSEINNLESGIIWLKISILKTENKWDNYSDSKRIKNACISDIVVNIRNDNPNNIKEAIGEFARGINEKNKKIISKFSNKPYKEVLEEFTTEFDEEAEPVCDPGTLVIHSDKTAFIFATEGGDGGAWAKFSYYNNKWNFDSTIYFSAQ